METLQRTRNFTPSCTKNSFAILTVNVRLSYESYIGRMKFFVTPNYLRLSTNRLLDWLKLAPTIYLIA